MSFSRRGFLLGLVVATLVLQPRCAGLFHQGRLDRAKEAQTALVAAKLTESLVEERAHNDAIHTRELTVDERASTAVRDAELLLIVAAKPSDGVPMLGEHIDTRLRVLGATDTAAIMGKLAAINSVEKQRDSFVHEYALRKTRDDPKVHCTSEAMSISFDARNAWNDFQVRCGDIRRLRQELAALTPQGEVGTLLTQLANVEDARTLAKNELDAADKSFTDAKKALAKEREKGKKVDLKAAAESLKASLDKVKARRRN